jgi:hypothetical protein
VENAVHVGIRKSSQVLSTFVLRGGSINFVQFGFGPLSLNIFLQQRERKKERKRKVSGDREKREEMGKKIKESEFLKPVKEKIRW